MKCLKCGVDLYEGIKKCPYCKTLTEDYAADGKFKDFDFKYTISSPEQLKEISKLANGVKEGGSSKKKAAFPFKIKRIEKGSKAEMFKKPENREIAPQKFDEPAKKVRDIVKSASKSAAEFVPEGLARYTIRGTDNAVIKPQVTSNESGFTINEYKRVKNTEKPKFERPKSYSRRSSRRRRRLKVNFDIKTIITGGVAVVVILALVIGVSAIINAVANKDEVVSSYTYVKDNGLYMSYKGKTLQLSEQVICDRYLRYADETENVPSPQKAAKNSQIIKESNDGKRTYFFDNFDPETQSGTLKLVKSGKAKKIIEISPAVHNSLVISKDGESLLYLQTTDKNGDMGVLYYWNGGLKEPFKVATDIDHGTFGFAGDDEWVVFIQNLNRVEMQGDLYAKSLKNLKDEKVKVDSAVCKIYGTNPGKAAYIYAKDYDKEDKSFDIYAINKKGRTIRLGERTKRDPLMQKTKDLLFVYGIAEDNTSNLYSVEINSGKKEKIASGVGSILMLSKNEKTVVYDKVYTGKLADYYAYTKGKQPQMVAHNVVVDYNAVAGKPQMAIDKDVTKILYISEFEPYKGGGTLNLCTYKNGKIVSEEQIAEDVRSVYRAEDGKFIVVKDYSSSRKIFDVYLLKGNEISLLKEEVSPEMFSVSNDGDSILCVTDFGVEGKYGNLERINLKAEAEVIAQQVFDFELTAEEDILLLKNLNTDDGKFDMGLKRDGKKKITEVDSGIDEIIGY